MTIELKFDPNATTGFGTPRKWDILKDGRTIKQADFPGGWGDKFGSVYVFGHRICYTSKSDLLEQLDTLDDAGQLTEFSAKVMAGISTLDDAANALTRVNNAEDDLKACDAKVKEIPHDVMTEIHKRWKNGG